MIEEAEIVVLASSGLIFRDEAIQFGKTTSIDQGGKPKPNQANEYDL